MDQIMAINTNKGLTREEGDLMERVKVNDVAGVRNILMFESQQKQKQQEEIVDDDGKLQEQEQQQREEFLVKEEHREQLKQQQSSRKIITITSSIVNCYDIKDGMTPLMFAKTIEMIEVLIEYGANINIQDNNGKTVLHYACYGGYYYYDHHERILILLQQYNANPNIQNNIGETSLHIACSKWDSKLISILIHYNADVTIQTITGNTPLHYMTQNYHYHDDIENGIQILCKDHSDIVNIQNQYGETALYNAIEEFGYYRKSCIQLLLNYKSNINIQRTVINLSYNNNSRCHHLFPNHLFPNDVKYHHHNNSIVGDTPLHCAIRNNDIHIIQLLFQYYPNLNLRNNDNETIYDLVYKMNPNNNTNKNIILQYIDTYIKHIRTISYQFLYEIWMNQK